MRLPGRTHNGGRRYAVIGLGQFGTALATSLAAEGAEVLAIDLRADPVEAIQEKVDFAVACDATDEEALRAQGVSEMDVVVVAIGSDFEAGLLVAVELLDLGAPYVVARASTATRQRILESVGVHQVISPERQMGAHLARLLRRPGLVDFLDLEDDYVVEEVRLPEGFEGQTLHNLDLPDRHDVSVITVRRCADDRGDSDVREPGERRVVGVPTRETALQKGDTLVLFGKRDKLDALRDSEQ